METNKRFDCLEMKNAIQQKMYAETKDMSLKELLIYFNGNKITKKKSGQAMVSGHRKLIKLAQKSN